MEGREKIKVVMNAKTNKCERPQFFIQYMLFMWTLLSQSGPPDFIRFLACVHHHDKGKGHLATHLTNPSNAKTLVE